MSLREGNHGFELWPICFDRGVVAIYYSPFAQADLSKYRQGEPAARWRQLSPSQSASLRRVAYEMAKGDTIYIKQGPLIVGRGTVTGAYKFGLCPDIRDDHKELWPHQVPVDWDADFPSFRLLLGGEQNTVLKLTPAHLSQLRRAMHLELDEEKEMEVLEGQKGEQTTRFRQRNRAIIAAKKRRSTGRCEACGMAFARRYKMPPRVDCLQVHHKDPMAERDGVRVTRFSDLVLLCPNCHAVTHAFTPPLTTEQLSRHIR